jgi:hypothetical protein
MRHLYIIGNGFDLNHGLKTSYKDFITWYLNKKIDSLINGQLERNSDGQIDDNDGLIHIKHRIPLTLHQENYSISEPKDFFEIINKISSHQYAGFSFTKSWFLDDIVKRNGWSDIERLYYTSMVNIHSMTNVKRGNSVFPYSIKGLNSCFESLKKELSEYMRGKILDDIIKVTPSDILEYCLAYYPLKGSTFNLTEGDKLFLIFNYTPTIDLYKSVISGNPQYVYIHGFTTDLENPMIFGYGDEMDSYYKKLEDEDDDDYLTNMKTFGYLKVDNYQKVKEFMDEGDEGVYVHSLGHSFGLSDRLLLNRIFEHENCRKIEINYYVDENGEDDYHKLSIKISRHFKDKSLIMDRVFSKRQSRPMN